MLKRIISLQVLISMIGVSVAPVMPVLAAEKKAVATPVEKPAAPTTSPVNWAEVNWDAEVVFDKDRLEYQQKLRELAVTNKTGEMAVLKPTSHFMYDEEALVSSRVPADVADLVRQYRAVVAGAGSDAQGAALKEAARSNLRAALTALYPATVSAETVAPAEPILDIRKTKRLRAAKAVPVQNEKRAPKVNIVNVQKAEQAKTILRGATMRQLRDKRGQPEAVHASRAPVTSIIEVFKNWLVPRVSAATPIIAYDNTLSKRPASFALYYLSNQQNADGSFGDADVYMNTMQVVELLSDINATNNDQYAAAYTYLLNTAPSTNREKAAKARILASNGQVAAGEALLTEVVASQNADKGFGLYSAYQSDVETSLQVALAMATLNFGINDKLPQTLAYVLAQVPQNGEMRYTTDSDPNYYLMNNTAQLLAPFKALSVGDGQNNVSVQSKIDAILNYLKSQYDNNNERIVGADTDDSIMTLETWRLYNVESAAQKALSQTIVDSQRTNGSFSDSLVMNVHAAYALATPDVVITDVVADGQLTNYSAEGFTITIRNDGLAPTGAATIRLFADRVEMDEVVDALSNNLLIGPNETLQLHITYNKTDGWTGATNLQWFWDSTEDVVFDSNWKSLDVVVASEANGKPALPMYYMAQKFVVNGQAVVNIRWKFKADNQRVNYVVLFREKGVNNWGMLGIDTNLDGAFVAGFEEGKTYEVTAGVLHQDLTTVTYSTDVTTVTTSAQDQSYLATVNVTAQLDGAVLPQASIIGNGFSGTTNEAGTISAETGNGTVTAYINKKGYEKFITKFSLASGAATQVRLITRLSEDVAPPVINSFQIQNNFNFIIKNQREVRVLAAASDNAGVASADFYLWDPSVNLWQFLGSQEFNGGNTVVLPWFVPQSLLGQGYKLKTTVYDFRGNSSSAEWGPFTIEDGTKPVFTFTRPAIGETIELGKPYTLQWTTVSSNPVNTVKLYAVYPNGQEISIKSDVPNTGSYTWDVPVNSRYVGENIVFKIIGRDSGNNEEGVAVSEAFSVIDTQPAPKEPWSDPEYLENGSEVKGPNLSRNNVLTMYDANGGLHLVYRLSIDDTLRNPRTLTQQIWHRVYRAGVWQNAELAYENITQIDGIVVKDYNMINNLKAAIDTNDRMYIAWETGPTNGCSVLSQQEINYVVRENGTWTAPINISNNNTQSFLADIVPDKQGGAHMVWLDGRDWDAGCNVGGNVYVAYSQLQGGAFSPVEQVGKGESPYNPRLAFAGATAHLLFTGLNNTVVDKVRAAGQWVPNTSFTTDGAPYELAVATGATSSMHLLTREYTRNPDTNNYYNALVYRQFENGRWENAIVAVTTTEASPDWFYRINSTVNRVSDEPHLGYILYSGVGRYDVQWTTQLPNKKFKVPQRVSRVSQIENSSLAMMGSSNQTLSAIWVGAKSYEPTLSSSFADLTVDLTTPATVSGIQVVVAGKKIVVSWNSYTDINGDFKQFTIYRSTTPRSDVIGLVPYATVNDLALTSYEDANATPGTAYYYQVVAEDTGGTRSAQGAFVGPVTVPVPQINEIIYEDAEDGLTTGWSFVQNLPGSTITNVDSGDQTHKRVIELTQISTTRSFSFHPLQGQPWDYQNFKVLSFDTKFSKDVQYFIFVNTTAGVRYLVYGTQLVPGKSGSSVKFLLDPSFKDGTWKTITRDLQKDLSSVEPGVTITSLTYFNVQGTGQIDNFKLVRDRVYGNISGTVTEGNNVPLTGVAVSTPESQVIAITDANGAFALPSLSPGTHTLTFTKFGYTIPTKTVTIPPDGTNQVVEVRVEPITEIIYEDAEDGLTTGWSFVQNLPGSTITNVDSGDQTHKRVIELTQLDSSKSFSFHPIVGQPWDYQNFKILSFDTKFSKDVQYFIFVNTTAGVRYLVYGTKVTPGKSGSSVRFLLDPSFKDGTWKTITRDLQKDLSSVEPGVTITSLTYFNVQGTGQIDNFMLKKSF